MPSAHHARTSRRGAGRKRPRSCGRRGGTAFDPVLAELFVQNIDKLEADAVAAARHISEMSYRSCVSSSTPMAPEDRHVLDPIDFSFELVSLYEFCAIAARSLNLEDILSGLDWRDRRLVPSNTCVFFLQASDSILKAAYASGTCAEFFLRLRIGLGRGVSGWAAAYHRPMLNAAAQLEFDEPNPVALSLRHTLAVPLLLNGDCLGTISLYGQEHIVYSEHHSNLLQAVARQARSQPSHGRGVEGEHPNSADRPSHRRPYRRLPDYRRECTDQFVCPYRQCAPSCLPASD